MIKKLAILTLVIMSMGIKSNAQQIELTGMAGYMWVGQYPAVKLGNNMNYMAGLYVSPVEGIGIEFSYTRTETSPSYRNNYYYNDYGNLGELTTEYFLLHIMRETKMDNITLYGLFGLGAGHFVLTESSGGMFGNTIDKADKLKFAIALGGGLKAYLGNGERVALRLQTRIMAPIQYGGLSIGCGTGGCGTGVSAGSAIISWDVQGGITLVLKKSEDAASFNAQQPAGGEF